MDKEFYTELKVSYKFPEDFGPRTIAIREQIWDINGDQLLNMFHTIMIGMTFQEQSFINTLSSYLEDNGYEVIPPNEKE